MDGTRTNQQPNPGEIRVNVAACGVCRTDLHVIDGELAEPHLPIIPGHEIVGRIDAIGKDVQGLELGERVGIPWLGHTCGVCRYCLMQRENLCDRPLFTGYTRNGGYATTVIADARFAFPLGEHGDDVSLAPLLCAGLIGWRSLVIAGDAERLGLYGFGAAAHILAQVAAWQGRSVFAFTRRGDAATQSFALSLGATWAGASDEAPPQPLDAAIIFAPIGDLVPLGPEGGAQGRPGRLRRYPHERHSGAAVSFVVGRARVAVGRQSHPAGRHRFSAAGPANRHRYPDHGLSAAAGKRGARRLAGRPFRGRRGARAVSGVCAKLEVTSPIVCAASAIPACAPESIAEI